VYSQKFRTMSRVLALAFLAALPYSLGAQVVASQGKGNMTAPAPRWDVFVGYSILDPTGTFYPIQPDGTVLPVSFKLEKKGLLESAAYFFNRNIGLQVESGQHDLFTNTGFASTGSSNSGIFTVETGLIYRWPGVHFTPFVHGLGGGAYVDGPDHEPYTWGPVAIVGGGLDWYPLCHNLGIRIFEADYEYIHDNSGPSHGSLADDNFVWGDDESVNGFRVAAGVVYRGPSVWSTPVGCGLLPPPALACVAAPSPVFPGEPVTVTATATDLNPKMTPTYTWDGVGASGNGATTTIATDTLAPGTYTVRGTVAEGTKNVQTANCEASFTVSAWQPPTLACVAMPDTIHPDQTTTVTLTGQSPQNLPLAYECHTASGPLTMNGNTALFSGNGSPEGTVAINCSVKDNKGHNALCNTSVTIKVPPPPIPHAVPLCTIDFNNDAKRPMRVDNEAKACLDQVSLSLQQNSTDTLVVVGETVQTDPATGAQRAVNTKNYLATEKGIDPSRITVVTGNEGTPGVQEYLVPQGAVFTSDVQGTTPVDENAIKPQERKPLPMRQHATHSHTAPKADAAPATTGAPAKPVHHKKTVTKNQSTTGKKSAGTPVPPPPSNGP
jgi:hypothetical protein